MEKESVVESNDLKMLNQSAAACFDSIMAKAGGDLTAVGVFASIENENDTVSCHFVSGGEDEKELYSNGLVSLSSILAGFSHEMADKSVSERKDLTDEGKKLLSKYYESTIALSVASAALTVIFGKEPSDSDNICSILEEQLSEYRKLEKELFN